MNFLAPIKDRGMGGPSAQDAQCVSLFEGFFGGGVVQGLGFDVILGFEF